MTYLLIKTLHLMFVIAWMATVFYLPRILVNLAETANEPAVQARLQLMGRRLYKFGHNMFGLAFVFGLVLWQGWRVFPAALPNVVASMHWIDAKLTLVALLLAYFIICGSMLKRAAAGTRLLPPARFAGSTNCRCCCCWGFSTWSLPSHSDGAGEGAGEACFVVIRRTAGHLPTED